MKHFQCKKCRTLIQSMQQPSSSNCPKGTPGATSHFWTDIGEVGNVNFQCKKCGAMVGVKNSPHAANCPSGSQGASMHDWNKL